MTDFTPPPEFGWSDFHAILLQIASTYMHVPAVWLEGAKSIQRSWEDAGTEEFPQRMALRFILGNDYTRLTKRPLKLDDTSMLMLEQIVEIEDMYGPGLRRPVNMDTLGEDLFASMMADRTRHRLRYELAATVVHLFRNPDIYVRRRLKGHLILDTSLTLLLSVVPLLSEPRAGVAEFHFAEALITHYRRKTGQPKRSSIEE